MTSMYGADQMRPSVMKMSREAFDLGRVIASIIREYQEAADDASALCRWGADVDLVRGALQLAERERAVMIKKLRETLNETEGLG